MSLMQRTMANRWRILRLLFVGATIVPMLWIAQLAVLTFAYQKEAQAAEQHSFDVLVPQSATPGSTPPFYGLGFIRVPKTGSTSILAFLGIESGLHPWSEFLYSASGFLHSSPTSFQKKMPFCVFGHAKNPTLTAKHDPNDGPNPFSLKQPDTYYYECPHLSYPVFQHSWKRSLQFMHPPAVLSSKDSPPLPVLQSFTMIRDPFDRLLSLFYYVKKDLGVPNQYRLFATTVPSAISLLEGESPQVFALLNECFELSLRLLEKKFSLRSGATDRFLKSPHFMENANSHRQDQIDNEEALREAAKFWFPGEFQFYNAVQKQFRRHVAASGIDVSTLQNTCPALAKQTESETSRMAVQYASEGLALSTPTIENTTVSTTTLLAFIRIQKTGSTSLLSFLTHASGLYSWDNFIYSATDYVKFTRNRPFQKNSLFCAFGHAAKGNTFEHDSRDGENPYGYNPQSVHNTCPHISRSAMNTFWKRSQRFANHPGGNENLSLQSVTMVRDPFDRMRSMYYYVRKFCNTTQAWKGMFSPAQYEQICRGDLGTWLSLLHKEEETHRVPYQYQFLDENLDDAISLMQGENPDVYMLLNECFEESLWFLERKFLLKPGVASAFVKSKSFKANANKQAPKQASTEEQILRQNVKRWFPSEYKFYSAAVEHFRRQMATIDLNRFLLRNPCDILRQEK